jgi:hypothetical protein
MSDGTIDVDESRELDERRRIMMGDSEVFTEACGFVMPLGKHKGATLARIGANMQGLLYLDWLVGQSWVNGPLKVALKAYLDHPAIARQLEAQLDD